MTVEEQIVEHLLSVDFGRLPAAAVDRAKSEILWTVGTSVAGAAAPGSTEVAEFARQLGGAPEATIFGLGDRLPASAAGFVNGVFAKALEYEDKFWLDHFHAYSIGVSVVPAALAVAEHIGGVSGKQLITAVALATDIEARMFKAATGSVATGWNATYTFASLAAAMASIKILGLDRKQAMDAMGLAYAQATGNYQGHQEGVLGVRMMMGFSVRNGIFAAQLGRLGISGVHQFLTGKYGLYPLFYRDIPYKLDWLTDGLGENFFGEQLGFKAYPCCAVIHPVLDSVLGLGPNLPAPEEIEAIEVYGNPRMRNVAEPAETRKSPITEVDSQFSIPWCVACAVTDRSISLSHFSAAALLDDRYRAFAQRVSVTMDPELDETFAKVRLKSGKELTTRGVAAPKGHFENPLTTDELVERYRDCLRHGPKPLDDGYIERTKDVILNLDQLDDVSDAIRLFGGP